MRRTKIEWTDATWSPLRVRVREDAAQIAEAKGYTSLIQIAEKMRGRVGPHCEHVSPGCVNCYSGSNNHRCLRFNGTGLPFDRRSRDLVEPFVDEKILAQPLRWKKAQRVFVENQSDLFGEWLPDEAIDRVFAIMALCPHHTFQCLSKRPKRMMEYFGEKRGLYRAVAIKKAACKIPNYSDLCEAADFMPWPYRNIWLGVSCEDQKTADERIPLLLQTPAAVRFASYEPALGPVDFTKIDHRAHIRSTLVDFARWSAKRDGEDQDKRAEEAAASVPDGDLGPGNNPWINALSGAWFDGWDYEASGGNKLDWIIYGGESGHGARPMHPFWPQLVRDQCRAAGVPFFFKQWGEYVSWASLEESFSDMRDTDVLVTFEGKVIEPFDGMSLLNPTPFFMRRVGKKAAGRLLDGREWNEFPEVRA